VPEVRVGRQQAGVPVVAGDGLGERFQLELGELGADAVVRPGAEGQVALTRNERGAVERLAAVQKTG